MAVYKGGMFGGTFLCGRPVDRNCCGDCRFVSLVKEKSLSKGVTVAVLSKLGQNH